MTGMELSMWGFRPLESILLAVLCAAGVACFVLAFTGTTSKWLTSAGLFMDIGGIVQLKISGLFERVLDTYRDEKSYPYGPPSHITRVIVSNPDTPLRSAVRDLVLFDSRAGFYLIVAGFALQLAGVWF
jgi:hypothetical protein